MSRLYFEEIFTKASTHNQQMLGKVLALFSMLPFLAQAMG